MSYKHFEEEINQIVQQYKDEEIKLPQFDFTYMTVVDEERTTKADVLGCHADDKKIFIHVTLYYDWRPMKEESCFEVEEKRAKYILVRLKRHLDAMLLLREVKQDYKDVEQRILQGLLSKHGENYVSYEPNGWLHLSRNALGKYVRDENMTKKQVEQIEAYAKEYRHKQILQDNKSNDTN